MTKIHAEGGVGTQNQALNVGGPDAREPRPSGNNSTVYSKIKNFFQRVIKSRVGAKAGHLSLGKLIKIGLKDGIAGLRNIAKGKAERPHSYTFQELTKAKARELLPYVGAAKLANGSNDFPDALKESRFNMGAAVRASVAEAVGGRTVPLKIPLSRLTPGLTASLDTGLRDLMEDLKGICSPEAYISPNGAVVDPETGLRATITRDPAQPDRFIIGFGCTGGLEVVKPETEDRTYEEQIEAIDQEVDRINQMVEKQSQANFSQYLGFEPKVYEQARQLVGAAAARLGTDRVTATGHSLGGGLAQYAGLYNGVKARCFNASPLGVGLQQILGERIEQAASLVEHVSMRGDWLSHSGAPLPIGVPKNEYAFKTGQDTRPRILSHLADLLGIRTRGNFGVKYYINFNETERRENMAQDMGIEVESPEAVPVLERESTVAEDIMDGIIEEDVRREKKVSENTVERHIGILDEMEVFAG